MKAIFEIKRVTEPFEIEVDFVLPDNKEMELQLNDQLRVKNIELKEIDLSNSFPIFRYKCQQVKKTTTVSSML
ncbi:hypothetical protein [Vibrio toranzoniae]|jgi:hypothetical protein|uniref:hypothetical protein n=1 Tax=Vibrio toranzoniae TaxID=1194427 RepID=UPI0013774CDB|nr:hypothetical protein [Vibrio toranzoniae]NAZ91264.1 hypothetical protein [Vibrio toranzoniae]